MRWRRADGALTIIRRGLHSVVAAQGHGAMKRSPQYTQGYRAATKQAVEWLHQRAREMNDSHARRVLNSAAFSFGQSRAADKRAAARPTLAPAADVDAGEGDPP